MIRVGVAGIPLSCKDRTNRDGIIYTKNLGLSAMEIQFARGFISDEEAAELKDVAEKCDIEIFVHSPYYIHLIGDERNVEMSKNKIRKSMHLADIMGAKLLTVHTGYYGRLSKKRAMERMVKNMRSLRNEFKKEGIEVPIGIETMGKREVFGSLDEVIEVCKRVHGIVPVLDMGHIHARGNGCLSEKKDFQEVFDKVSDLEMGHYLIHVTGVKYDRDGELYHVPIRKGDMPVLKMMECIVENDYNVTLISESPILEHDAVYAQILLDRAMEMSK